MTIDQTLEQIAQLRCPQQVDVVDRVMQHVEAHPYLRPLSSRRHLWKPIGAVAAAATVALLLLNVVSVYSRSYDETSMGNTIAQLNDYSSWSTIEEGAVNPLEYLYEEQE